MKSILIVEDEFYFRQALKKYITEYIDEFTICGEADNGIDGLQLMLDIQPNIALVDITIPSLNGLDMVEQARQAGCATHIIILTGYSEFAYARKAISLQVQDYLLKPIKSEDLYSALRRTADIIDHKRTEILKRREDLATQSNLKDLLREHCVEMLLHHLKSPLAYEELAEVCDFPTLDGGYYLAMIDILIDIDEDWVPEDRQLCNYALTNVAGEVLSKRNWSIIGMNNDQTICIILHMNSSVRDVRQYLEAEMMMLLSTVRQYLKLQCIVTLSGEESKLREISQMYQHAQATHAYHVMRGQSGVFFDADDHFMPGREVMHFTSANRRNLTMLLYAGNGEAVHSYIREMFERMDTQQTTLDIVYISTVEIYSVILEYISEFGIETPQNLNRSFAYREIMSRKSLVELYDFIAAQVDYVLGKTQGKTSENQKELVRWISEYLNEHFDDPSLSLKKIADEFFLNIQYMCALYKNHTGDTIGNHLFHIRMDNAKKALGLGKYTMTEVAESCGYTDAGYFSKCFKRYYGISPRQYISGRGVS